MSAAMRVLFAAALALSVRNAIGQDSAESKPDFPVLTVCEALGALAQHNGKIVVVVGKLVSTMEGAWLSEDRNRKLVTDGYTWKNVISLTYARGAATPAPALPRGFSWDAVVLKAKLSQVQKTTTLQVLKEHNYTDKWFAIFGRFEARVPPRVVLGSDSETHGWGYGHMNAAPAQLVSGDDGRRELKTD